MHAARRSPRRRGSPGARPITALLLVAGLLLACADAGVARAETPAQRIARLRAEAAKVEATIGRMNDQVEALVEQYDANQEALQATLGHERDTRRRLDDARERLTRAESVLGERIRAIYIDGPVTGIEQLLQVRTLGDAVTMAHYQQSATDADVRAIQNVQQSRQRLTSAAATLASQQRQQERIRAELSTQRHDIERKLAGQRSYLDRLSGEVKRAVAEEQRRQEELRRQALARKLAAERAARLKAAQEAAAQQQATSAPAPAPASTSTSSSSTSTSPTSAAEQAVAFARAQLGKPYEWGASGPDSYDCSGLTMAAYQSAGVSIPRTSAGQWTIGTHIRRMVDLLPGDLVFYAYDLGDPATIHHVGIYIGDGMMIEAPHTGGVVQTASINRPDYFGATRPT